MKRAVVIVLCALLLSGCASPAAETPVEEVPAAEVPAAEASAAGTYRQITMEEAAALMEARDNYLIVDVRTVEEYESAHIPGAICIPNESIQDTAPAELPDRDQLILIYCRSGNRSKQASQKLADLGYANIVEFGGIRDWTGETVSGAD